MPTTMSSTIFNHGPDGQLILGGSRLHDGPGLVLIGKARAGLTFAEPLGLPAVVRVQIEEQFRAAAKRAPEHFADNKNDEDSISGAFGAVLKDTVKGAADGFTWKTAAKKLRGRGDGAGEKRYGADLAIEIQVESDGKPRRKTLLVQAKKNWDGKDGKLAEQASKICGLPGDGAVFDYRPGEYRAVRASVAAKAEGNARFVPVEEFRSAGDLLADFVACRIGSTRIFYVVDDDQLIVADDDGVRVVEFAVAHLARTTVTRDKPKRTRKRRKKKRGVRGPRR